MFAPVPSADILLDEFLTRMARIEADFTRRWDAARLGTATGVHQRALRPEWRLNV